MVVDDWLHIKFHNPPDAEKVFILGSSLRYSWDTVVKEKLEAINKKIKIITKSADMEKTKKEGEEEVVPTTFYGTKLEAAAMSSEESTSNLTTSTSRIDFSTFPDMIPACFARIRQDWQQSGIVDGEVEVEDVMDQLGEFLALNELCVVERLRTQDLSSIVSSYEPI